MRKILAIGIFTIIFIFPIDNIFGLSENTVLCNNNKDNNPNENLDSGLYLISYEEKIAKIAVDNLHNIALEINTNMLLNS